MIARNSKLAQAGFELAHVSGVFRLAERRAAGTGAILRLEHVRPRSTAAFQPLKHKEITPRFLERMIRALQRWKFDFVSIAEARARAQRPRGKTRFVVLTFDGAYRDFMKHAYPVLQRYEGAVLALCADRLRRQHRAGLVAGAGGGGGARAAHYSFHER